MSKYDNKLTNNTEVKDPTNKEQIEPINKKQIDQIYAALATTTKTAVTDTNATRLEYCNAQAALNNQLPASNQGPNMYWNTATNTNIEIQKEQAKNHINELSEEYKAIADRYLMQGRSAIFALEQAQAQQEIHTWEQSSQDIAMIYLKKWMLPSLALKEAKAYEKIQTLSETQQQTVQDKIDKGYTYVTALMNVQQWGW